METVDEDVVSSAGVWLVLARAYRSMAMYVERAVASLGIGLSDFMILEALLHKGPLTMSAIGEKVLLANASMTAAVDRLEKRGLVARCSDTTDRRAKKVGLTAEGEKVIRELYAQHEKDIDAVMTELSIADKTKLRQMLKTVGIAAQAKMDLG